MTASPAHPTLAQIDHAHGDDHAGHVRTYMRVFVSLAIFTAIEYFYARMFSNTFAVLVLGLMTWAIIKASLVGLYFMHLKYEGKWVFGMLIPAGILACVLVFGLMPDIAMQPVVEMNRIEDESAELTPQTHAPSAAPHGPSAGAGARH